MDTPHGPSWSSSESSSSSLSSLKESFFEVLGWTSSLQPNHEEPGATESYYLDPHYPLWKDNNPPQSLPNHASATAWNSLPSLLIPKMTTTTTTTMNIHDITQRGLLADDEDDGGDQVFGVHVTYQQLYHAILFFAAIYVGGKAAHYLKMPTLVGEIMVGILLGPPLANWVPNPEAFVMLGEMGLMLLVVEAGIDVDVSSLRLIGTRGVLIAFVGSLLPISLGILLAVIVQSNNDNVPINGIECLAAGATFGPTSVGVALSLLRSGGLLNTPVGQLIIAAAVIDDMIALIVLSQLENLNNADATTNAWTILSPIVLSTVFLIVGGTLALFWVPPCIQKWLHPRIPPEHIGKAELACLFAMIVGLMPAAHYIKASYLMGAFLAGLAFCTSQELHSEFVRQFKRILQWLLRIFFAASIGFQVPIREFWRAQVLWKGAIFCFALTGKFAVGFLVPNFTQSPAFTDRHLRDCLLTGFSMASEGEFAFVIAVFSVGQGLIHKDLYASVVLAVLLSTIIPPFGLRATIAYYNQKAQEQLKELANAELERKHNLDNDDLLMLGDGSDNHHHNSHNQQNGYHRAPWIKIPHGGPPLAMGGSGDGSGTMTNTGVTTSTAATTTSKTTLADGLTVSQHRREQDLMGSIVNRTAVFLCIQSHSEGRWGLMLALMSTLAKLGLEVIDHRAWHPRGIDTTLVSEIYAKDILKRRRRRRRYSGSGSSVGFGGTDVEDSHGGGGSGSGAAGGGSGAYDYESTQEALEFRLEEIKEALEKTINQPDVARVKVQRWYPGVVEQIVEESNHGPLRRHLSLEASLWKEASARLNHKQSVQTQATREKTINEILLGDLLLPELSAAATSTSTTAGGGTVLPEDPQADDIGGGGSDSGPHRRGRRKVRSSPVVGGGLFGETTVPRSGNLSYNSAGLLIGGGAAAASGGGGPQGLSLTQHPPHPASVVVVPPVSVSTGRAEISIDNGAETYEVRVSTGTLKKLRGAYYQRYQGNRRSGYHRYGYLDGFWGGAGGGGGGSNNHQNSFSSFYDGGCEDLVDLHIQPSTDDVTDMLHGYIRHGGPMVAPPQPPLPPPLPLSQISENNNNLQRNNANNNSNKSMGQMEPRPLAPAVAAGTADDPERAAVGDGVGPQRWEQRNNTHQPKLSPGMIIRRSLQRLPVSLSSPRRGGATHRSHRHGSGTSGVRTEYSPLTQPPPLPQSQQQQQQQQAPEEDEEEIEFHDVLNSMDRQEEDVLFELHSSNTNNNTTTTTTTTIT